jgi:hypothetical protein
MGVSLFLLPLDLARFTTAIRALPFHFVVIVGFELTAAALELFHGRHGSSEDNLNCRVNEEHGNREMLLKSRNCRERKA